MEMNRGSKHRKNEDERLLERLGLGSKPEIQVEIGN